MSEFTTFCFFFNDTATTEIYTYGHTLSLHDALPIYGREVLTRRIARAVAHRLQDDMFIQEIVPQLKRSEHQDDQHRRHQRHLGCGRAGAIPCKRTPQHRRHSIRYGTSRRISCACWLPPAVVVRPIRSEAPTSEL